MMTRVGLASGGPLYEDQEALCLADSPPCAYPTLLGGVSRPVSLVGGNRIFLPSSSPDSSLDSCHIHPPRTPWGWDTFSWHWASQETSLSAVQGGGKCAPRMPEISSGLPFRLFSLSEPVGVLVVCLSS